jgi:hypothetical protein
MISKVLEAIKLPTLTGRVKSVNIDAKVYWILCPNPLFDLLDDTVHADCVNLTGLHDFESTITIVFVVGWP